MYKNLYIKEQSYVPGSAMYELCHALQVSRASSEEQQKWIDESFLQMANIYMQHLATKTKCSWWKMLNVNNVYIPI